MTMLRIRCGRYEASIGFHHLHWLVTSDEYVPLSEPAAAACLSGLNSPKQTLCTRARVGRQLLPAAEIPHHIASITP
jgi:hypothetical protein